MTGQWATLIQSWPQGLLRSWIPLNRVAVVYKQVKFSFYIKNICASQRFCRVNIKSIGLVKTRKAQLVQIGQKITSTVSFYFLGSNFFDFYTFKVANNLHWKAHQDEAFFSFLISLVAHCASVFVLLVFERRPFVSSWFIVSLSTNGNISDPNAVHKSLKCVKWVLITRIPTTTQLWSTLLQLTAFVHKIMHQTNKDEINVNFFYLFISAVSGCEFHHTNVPSTSVRHINLKTYKLSVNKAFVPDESTAGGNHSIRRVFISSNMFYKLRHMQHVRLHCRDLRCKNTMQTLGFSYVGVQVNQTG